MDNAYNAGTWTLASQTYGNGDAWHYEYNEYDEVVRAYTTGGSTGTELRYFYNSEGALGRIEQYATVLSGSTITGRTWVSTERYYYDSSDRATRITRQDADGDSYECSWEYDHNDNVTNLVEVVNGQTHATAYTYDNDQRISALTRDGSTASYTYDGFGRLEQQVTKRGEDTVLTKDYEFRTVTVGEDSFATSQISTLTLDAAGFDRTYTYTYDENGNILSVSDGVNTTSYTYDALNQLTKEVNQAAGMTWEYTYDNGGNITSRKEYDNATGALVSQVGYTYGDTHWGDLLTAYNGQTITYDGIGNPLNDGTWEYTWENGRQLASMTRTGETWEYSYNADCLRTERSNGTLTYDYIYSGSQLIQMTVGNDTLYFTYDASGTPMSVAYNGTNYYYATNIQGDVIAILDTNGNAVVEYTYDAWGNHLSVSGTMADTLGAINPLRYRGYVYDTETTLYYLQSRYYDPELGRFINADTYASTGQGILGNNMFSYCNNNPVMYADPSGKFIDLDLYPNQQSAQEFTEWYMHADSDATTSDGELTLEAKLKRSIRAFATSIEFAIGFGMGFFAGASLEDYASANVGVYNDLVRFQYIDGQFDICQYHYSGYDANIAYIFSLGDPQIETNTYLDDKNEWVAAEQGDVLDLYSASLYLYGGGTIAFNWDFIELGQALKEIWG